MARVVAQMPPPMIHLGVNLDHIATVREARRTVEPDPIRAAVLAELGGADNITVHLREDRRHIQERDVRLLRETISTRLNLEMAVDPEVLAIATEVRPKSACIVPERREELTTEGGLRVDPDDDGLRRCVDALHEAGIAVALFVEPEAGILESCRTVGADAVELHTGTWAEAWIAHRRGRGDAAEVDRQLHRLEDAAAAAAELRLELHAGHGIAYDNVGELLHLPLLRELNIGHSIVSRAVLVGLERAVSEMKALLAGIG